MAQSKLYPVVMAGGSGSRLWPLSRVLYPKQFLCLKGDLTMLQTTICRLNGVECESPVVICTEHDASAFLLHVDDDCLACFLNLFH